MNNFLKHHESQFRPIPSEIRLDEDVALRTLQPSDAERVGEILKKDQDISRYVVWVEGVADVADIQQRIQAFISSHALRYGIIQGSQLVGYVGAWVDKEFNKSDEYDLGYFVDPEYRGKGLVTRTAEALMRTLEESQPVSSFSFWIAESNLDSQAVAKRLGLEITDQTFVSSHGDLEYKWTKRVANHGQ